MEQTAERLALRIPDLARVLGISEIAARRLVERGDVPSRRMGRRVVILREELEAHLRSLPLYRSDEGHSGEDRPGHQSRRVPAVTPAVVSTIREALAEIRGAAPAAAVDVGKHTSRLTAPLGRAR